MSGCASVSVIAVLPRLSRRSSPLPEGSPPYVHDGCQSGDGQPMLTARLPAAALLTEGDNEMQGRTRRRRAFALVAAAAAVAVPGFASAPAQASLLGLAGDQCPTAPLSRPFTPWSDYANYELAPAGNFETSAAGWSLTNGAAVVAGNESYRVDGNDDGESLSLPQGSSATSP